MCRVDTALRKADWRILTEGTHFANDKQPLYICTGQY